MRIAAHDEDHALLARSTQGDGEAFGVFYRRHLPAVAGYLLRRTRDAEATADLTAEVFAAALVAASRYRPGGPSALAWLYGIAANKLHESWRRGRVDDNVRRRLAWEPLKLDQDDVAEIELLAGASSESAVLDAVRELPRDQREAILAHVVDDRGYAEIAADLRCSESVIRQRVSRGLRTLRGRMEQAG